MEIFFFLLAVGIYIFPGFIVYLILGGKIKNLESRIEWLILHSPESKRVQNNSKSVQASSGQGENAQAPERSTNTGVPEKPLPAAVPELPKPAAAVPPLRKYVPKQPMPKPPPSLWEKLREWKIVPPKGMPLEEAIMQWWAPRLGGMLALLALIFFGVWASQFSSPLVKVAEMTAVAVAVTAFGCFLRCRGNVAVGAPLTATGTTMFYLVALAAGTFPATKIFDNTLWALTAQVLAIIPTVRLGRGKFLPMLLALVFAFISSFFAVACDAGAAALVTSLLAYLVAAWFCAKKNTPGLLLAGALGAFLPVWIMKSGVDADNAPMMFSGARNIWDILVTLSAEAKLGHYLAYFACGIVLPSAALLAAKNRSRFGKFIYAFACIHAFLATRFALSNLCLPLERFPVSGVSLTTEQIVFGAFFLLATIVFSANAYCSFRRFRENKFLFEFNLVASSLALPLAIFFWTGAGGGNDVLFYAMLVEGLLLAYIGRSLNTKWSLISLVSALAFAAFSIGPNMPLVETCLHAAVCLLAFGWFFGDKKQWGDEGLKQLAYSVCGIAGILAGASLCSALYDFAEPVVARIIFPLACLAFAVGGAFLPRLAKSVFASCAAIWVVFVFYMAIVDVFAERLPFSYWLVTGGILTLIAVPAFRCFVKDEKLGSLAELGFTAPCLACLTGILFLSRDCDIAGLAFAVPLLALFAGTPWTKGGRFSSLARRGADISALPLIVIGILVASNLLSRSRFSSDFVPFILSAYLFLPFVVPAMRGLLRERPWFAVSASVTGSACLLYWGFLFCSRFLTAEAVAIALGLIFAGLLTRVRCVRIVGIALLALALLRLFVSDIDDTVWRIVAFALVSLTLFLLGFVYQALSRKNSGSLNP